MPLGLSSLVTSPGLNVTPDTSTVKSVAQPYAGYVGNMLGNAQALANAPMPAYTGQLTSGPSDLQKQAWNQLSNTSLPQDLTNAGNTLGNTATQAANIGSTFKPTDFTNTYASPGAYKGSTASTANFNGVNPATGQSYAQEYMNPYLSSSLAPQLQLLQQQLDTQNAATNAKLAQAGAYGGGRQAVANAQNELNSNLAANSLISQGYNTAFNNAQNAFAADQARNLQAQQANIGQEQFGMTTGLTEAQQQAQALQAQQAQQEAASQFGANLGLQGLQAATSAAQGQGSIGANESLYGLADTNALATAGGTQQGLNQNALNAQYNQYLNQLQYPQTMLNLQKNMLSNLPMTNTTSYSAMKNPLQQVAGVASGLAALSKDMQGSGLTSQGLGSMVSGYLNGNQNNNNGIINGIQSLLPTTPSIIGGDQNAATTAANAFGTSVPSAGYMSTNPSADLNAAPAPATYNPNVFAGADQGAGDLANNIFGSSSNESLTGQ